MAIVEAAQSYDPSKAQFATWAVLHAKAACRKVLRQHGVAARLEPDLEPQAITVRDADSLGQALRSLPRRWATVITRRLQGDTRAAIGAALGISESMVRKIEGRAVEALRARLDRRAPAARPTFGRCWSNVRPREACCSACFARAQPRRAARDAYVHELVRELFADAARASRR